MDDIILIGYGGHGKSVADCIERGHEYNIVGYTDLQQHDSVYNYLGKDSVLEEIFAKGIKNAAVGIGYMGKGDLRERLYIRLKELGYNLPVISDPSSIVSPTAKIDEGTFIGKGAIINADAVVEKMSIINTRALVEHECIVREYSHIAVGAVLCGQVTVGKACFIGANATVIQERKIESDTIVPAGAVVR